MIIREGYVCTAISNDDGKIVYFYDDYEYSGGFPAKSDWFDTKYMKGSREAAESDMKYWYEQAYHDFCSDFRVRKVTIEME